MDVVLTSNIEVVAAQVYGAVGIGNSEIRIGFFAAILIVLRLDNAVGGSCGLVGADLRAWS